MAIGRVVLLLVVSGVSTTAAAQSRSFVEDPAFDQLNQTGERQHSGEAPVVRRGSIDVEILAAVIRERSEQAAVAAVSDALVRAGVSSNRRYIRDVLQSGASMIGSTAGVQPHAIRSLLARIIRAAIAESVVATKFPDDAALKRAERWGAPLRNWRPESVPDERLPVLRGYLVDWAYYRLAAHPWCFETHREAPSCPFDPGDANGRALCSAMEVGSEPERDARVDRVLGIGRIMDALATAADVQRAIESLPSTSRLSVETLVRIAMRTVPGALDDNGAIDPARWLDLPLSVGVPEVDFFVQVAQAASITLRASARPDAWSLRALRQLARAIATNPRLQDAALQPLKQWVDALAAMPDAGGSATLVPPPNVAMFASWSGAGDLLASLMELRRLYAGGQTGATRRQEIERAATHALAQLRASRGSLPPSPLTNAVEAWLDRIGATVASADLPALPDGLEVLGAMTTAAETFAYARRILEAARGLVDTAKQVVAFIARTIEGVALGDVPLEDLPELAELLKTSHRQLGELQVAVAAVAPSAPALAGLRTLRRDVGRAAEAITLVASVRGAAQTGNLGELVGALARLGGESSVGRIVPLVQLLDPILARLRAGEAINADIVLEILRDLDPNRLVVAFGLMNEGDDPCAGTNTAACWTTRLLDMLKDSIVRTETDGRLRLQLDGERIARQAAALGDDFHRGRCGTFFFHLTIGMGGLYSAPPHVGTDGVVTAGDSRLVALTAEQIGAGMILWATPQREFVGKLGVFASGLLYRIVMDSAESDAIMGGGFFAVDLYELIEAYAAVGAMLYPPVNDESYGPRAAFTFGVQVPLGAYLERLAD